jgi:hypothetical protein
MAPNFAAVVQLIAEENTSWCPQMPIKYRLADPNKKKSLSPFPDTGTLWSGGAASDMSGLTSEETPPGDEGGATRKTAGEIEPNPSPSEQLIPFRAAMKKLTIMGIKSDPELGNPPSIKVNGRDVEICASYHVRGSCYKNCSRRPVHRPLTSNEEVILLAWCKKFQAKADAS